MNHDEYADEAAYAEQQAAYEADQERAYQEYADTPCAGCQHPRHWHTDGGIEHRLRTGMPCIAEDPDVADEERGVECNCLGYWEPGTPCPYGDSSGFAWGEHIVVDDDLPPNTFKIGDKLFEIKPVEIDGYCTCYPDQRGRTADCGIPAHREEASKKPAEEEVVPTEIVEDPDMPVGGGVFSHEKVFEQFAKLGGQGPYQLGKEMTEEMFGGPVEPGPEEVEAPSCIGCGRSMFSAVYHSRPVWWCSECNERRPRSLDGMSTVEEHKDSTDRVLEGFDAEVERAAKINDVELMLMRWRYGSDEQQREDARKVAAEIVRRLS